MAVRQLGIMGIARGLAGPVEQRHIEQAVNDIAVVVFSAQRTPCLKEAALLLKAGAELVSGQNGGAAALFAAGQLVGCHAGRAVQKAHIVVVYLDLVFNPVQKAVHQRQRGIFERRITGALIAEPDLARPEAAGPLVVLALGIDVMNTGMVLAMVCIQRQILPHKSHGGIQRLFGLRLRQDFIGECFHGKPLFS